MPDKKSRPICLYARLLKVQVSVYFSNPLKQANDIYNYLIKHDIVANPSGIRDTLCLYVTMLQCSFHSMLQDLNITRMLVWRRQMPWDVCHQRIFRNVNRLLGSIPTQPWPIIIINALVTHFLPTPHFPSQWLWSLFTMCEFA